MLNKRVVRTLSLVTRLSLFLLIVLFGASGCRSDTAPEETAEAFLRAWAEGNYEAMYDLLDAASQERYAREYFIDRYTNISSGIGLRALKTELNEKRAVDKNTVQLAFTAEMDTYTVGAVPIANTITLTRQGGEPWRLAWAPTLIFPELTEGRRVELVRDEPRRGTISDRHGRIIAGYRAFKEVGAVPGRYSDEGQFVRDVAAVLAMDSQAIEEKLRQPWVKEGLFVPLAILAPEQEELIPQLLEIPGVMINDVERRYYPAGEAVAHLAGYIGEISAEELEENRELGYYPGYRVGKSGLEAVLNPILGGAIGYSLNIVEADGTPVSILACRDAQPAEDVVLTIDLELQQAAAEALQGKTGALVALDPATGEILALVSNPGYDPNWFIAGLEPGRWQQLLENPAKPLQNRALHGLYPPGSVFKPYTAAVALEEKKLDPEEYRHIEGKSWQPDPSWGGYRVERTYTDRTDLNLFEAMRASDNIYFAQVGLTLGAELFVKYGAPFGFGETIPFPMPVAVSRLFREAMSSEIQLADSSYGQGEVQVSPLHMSLIYAVFPSGGVMPEPQLFLDSVSEPAVWKKPVSNSTAATVHRALVEAVEGERAAAGGGKIEGYTVAGKTGTAQIEGLEGNICWYVTYGPAKEPELVVAVVVEGGSWGGVDALPVGRAVLEKYLKEDRDVN